MLEDLCGFDGQVEGSWNGALDGPQRRRQQQQEAVQQFGLGVDDQQTLRQRLLAAEQRRLQHPDAQRVPAGIEKKTERISRCNSRP